MTNKITIFTILCIFFASTQASGIIEILISSPKIVFIEPTVCPNFECPAPDELSLTRKVQADIELHFATGQYHGEARERIDLHLKVLEPTTNEIIAVGHFRPLADNNWNKNASLIITTSSGFNITLQLRNKCDTFYHGKRCGRYCIPSHDNHWECSLQGERICAVGWSGVDCSIPKCPAGCNGRGRCIAPNKCFCMKGFNGTQCEKCIPRAGCLNGRCLNGIPNTCKCQTGFVGEKCDIDVKVCSTQNPCRNGGRCSIDLSSSSGYKCECPFNFLGARCDIPLANVKCASTEHVCQNGGTCISLDDKTIQCKCPRDFTGKFCELGIHKNDCKTMNCYGSSECHMADGVPICVTKTSTTTIPEMRKGTKSTEKQVVEKLQNRISLVALGLLCIVGLILSIVIIYTRMFSKLQQGNVLPMMMPMSPTSSASSPIHKVCTISSKASLSDSDQDHFPHRHSPPPAYSSPVMLRVYKSIPIDEDATSFRN